jgi:uncharacterized delta-60 repeat protein
MKIRWLRAAVMVAASLTSAASVAADTRSRWPAVFPFQWPQGVVLALDGDGRLLVAGADLSGYTVARLLGDGTYDKSYGESGLARWARPHEVRPREICLDAAGRLVVLGFSELARFTAGGKPDPSFGVAGVVMLSMTASDLAVAPGSGQLIIAGACGASGKELCVQCYTPEGKLDASFGTDGIFRTQRVSVGPIVAARPDGGVFVAMSAAQHGGANARQVVVLALTRDGRIDTAWGNDGFVFLAWTTETARIFAVPLLLHAATDGSVLIAGSVTKPIGQAWAFARLTPAGHCEETWGERGLVLTDCDARVRAELMGILSDGKIFVAGSAIAASGSVPQEPGPQGVYLARFLSGGAYDPAFGDGGQAVWIVDQGQNLPSFTGAGESASGTLFASGYSTSDRTFAAPFTTNGAIDTPSGSGFLKPAKLYRSLNPREVAARAAARQAPAIVCSGQSDREVAVAASNAAGAAREPAFLLLLDRLRSAVKARDQVFWRALVADLKGTAATGWETAWDIIIVTHAEYYADRLAYDPTVWDELEQVLAATPTFRHADFVTEVELTAKSGKGRAAFKSSGDTWMLIDLHLPGDDYESAVPEEKRIRPER